jgi:hypothetical protein
VFDFGHAQMDKNKLANEEKPKNGQKVYLKFI